MRLLGAVTLGMLSLDTITEPRRHQKWLNHLAGRYDRVADAARCAAGQPETIICSALGGAALDDGATFIETSARANPVRHHRCRAAGARHHIRGGDLVVIGSAHIALAAAQTSFRNGHEDYSFLIFCSSRLLSSANGDKRGSRGSSPPGWLSTGSGGLAAASPVGKSERRG